MTWKRRNSVYFKNALAYKITERSVNPRPVRAFLITRTVRGGGGGTTPPWRSAPDGRRASRKKPVDAPRRDLAIAHIVFGPRSIFDLVRSGQRSNFREKWHFFALHAHSGVSMCRSDLKPSPACYSFNSEQDRMLLLYPAAIFSIRSAPKYNGITLAGRHRRNGQNSNWSNDGDWPRAWGRSDLETFLGTINHRFRFSTSGNPTKHMPIGYLSLLVQPRSVTTGDLSWPWPSSGAMSRVTSSHVLTPISSTIPMQVNRTTPSCVYSRFRWNLAKVVPLMTS